MGPVGAGLLQAGLGGLFSLFGGRARNRNQIRMMREQMRFQERMSSTAFQRQTKDLSAAGLNRILGLSGQGASSPPGAMAGIQDVVTPAVNTALSARRARAEVELIGDQAHSARTQAAANDMNAGRLKAEAGKINLETRIRRLDETLYSKYPQLRLIQMGTLPAGAAAASALGLMKLFKKRAPSQLYKRGKPSAPPKRPFKFNRNTGEIYQ